jgi:hypothetical protein
VRSEELKVKNYLFLLIRFQSFAINNLKNTYNLCRDVALLRLFSIVVKVALSRKTQPIKYIFNS